MNALVPFEQIVNLTEAMLTAAQEGHWEQLAEMQQRRESLLGDCFSEEDSVQDPVSMRQQVAHVMDLDKRIMALARHRQEDLAKTLGDFNVGRQATRAYKKASR